MQNLRKLTDDQLVAEFAKGVNPAFDELLDRHKQRVHSYILRIVKDEDLADDVFQETFLKVITTVKQGRYTADGKFASWILRIAHNAVIDHFRREKVEALVSTDEDEYDILNRRDLCDDNIEDELCDLAIRSDIRHLVKALPREQRQVLVMRYYSSMSFKEIAERTGVSINTALGRMRYALLNLRRMAAENRIELTR